jgi:hypothetical protein
MVILDGVSVSILSSPLPPAPSLCDVQERGCMYGGGGRRRLRAPVRSKRLRFSTAGVRGGFLLPTCIPAAVQITTRIMFEEVIRAVRILFV